MSVFPRPRLLCERPLYQPPVSAAPFCLQRCRPVYPAAARTPHGSPRRAPPSPAPCFPVLVLLQRPAMGCPGPSPRRGARFLPLPDAPCAIRAQAWPICHRSTRFLPIAWSHVVSWPPPPDLSLTLLPEPSLNNANRITMLPFFTQFNDSTRPSGSSSRPRAWHPGPCLLIALRPRPHSGSLYAPGP